MKCASRRFGLVASASVDQALGGRRVAALQRDDAECVPRRRDLRIHLERAAKELLRARHVAAIEPDFPHLILHERILGIERQVVLEAGERRLVVPHATVGLREIVDGEIVVGLQRERVLEVLDGLVQVAVRQALRPHHEPRVDDFRIRADDLIQERHDAIERRAALLVDVLRQLCRFAELVEEVDLVLGIGAPGSRVGRCRHERSDVAQRRQPLPRVGIHRRRRNHRLRLRETLLHRPQPRDHRIGERPAAVVEIRRLRGIPFFVVQLGTRGVDHLVAPGAQRVQIAPAVVVEGIHGLRVRVEPQLRSRPGKKGSEADPREAAGRRDPEQIERGRHDVDAPHGIRDGPAQGPAERRADRERHVRRAVVDEEAVCGLAVIAEAFSVVPHDHDHGAVVQAEVLQRPEHARDLRIGEGDFAVVGVFLVLRCERLRRPVRRVRVVEMDPGEERPGFRRHDPRQRLIDDLVGRPLDRRH